MNKTPSILVDTGFEVDQNGALTEIVIPKVVNTLNVPRKITFEGQVLNWVPSTAAALQEFVFMGTSIAFTDANLFASTTALTTFSAPNCISISTNDSGSGLCRPFFGSAVSVVNLPNLEAYSHPADRQTSTARGLFVSCGGLYNLSLPKLKTISIVARNGVGGYDVDVGLCVSCNNLTNLSLPALEIFDNSKGGSLIVGCPAIESLSFPSLVSVNTGGQMFRTCTGLLEISMPVITTIRISYGNVGMFHGLTSLQTVTLGSSGHPVTSIPNGTFNGCTQAGLTITIYTTGGASLAGEPWGATNADTDIVYEVA